MDDSLGDIIYFLMIAIFALAGMLGKKKKKKPTIQQDTGSPAFPNPWSELEKKLLEKEEPIQPKPTPAPQSRRTETRTTYKNEIPSFSSETIYSSEYEEPIFERLSYDTVDDVSKLRIKKQMKESISKKQSVFKSTEIKDMQADTVHPFEVAFDDVDDAKRAFIYSEIFNRKY